jgi:hypothetical protein
MLSEVPSVDDASGGEDPPPKRPWRWLNVPKAALVTVLGLALSAWLLPALTRQWDDRRREHEFKAAIVADIASSTARALVGGEAIWSGKGRPLTDQERARLRDQWALSALEIEAQLRSYFPGSVAASWEVYSWVVDRFIDANHVSVAEGLGDAVNGQVRLDSRVSDAAAQLLVSAETFLPPGPTFAGDRQTDRQSVRRLEQMLAPDMKRYRDENGSISTWSALERRVLGVEQAVADQILGSDAAGFSTTWGDLLNDLLP